MKFNFSLNYLTFKNKVGKKWWEKSNILAEVLNVLDKHFNLKDYLFFDYNDKCQQVNGIDDIVNKANKIKNNRDLFELKRNKIDEDKIMIGLTNEDLYINIFNQNGILNENIKK